MNEQPIQIVDTRDENHPEAMRRDRLLAAIALITGIGLCSGCRSRCNMARRSSCR